MKNLFVVLFFATVAWAQDTTLTKVPEIDCSSYNCLARDIPSGPDCSPITTAGVTHYTCQQPNMLISHSGDSVHSNAPPVGPDYNSLLLTTTVGPDNSVYRLVPPVVFEATTIHPPQIVTILDGTHLMVITRKVCSHAKGCHVVTVTVDMDGTVHGSHLSAASKAFWRTMAAAFDAEGYALCRP